MAVNNNFAYIEKTLAGVVDKVFRVNSLTETLIGGSEIKLDFLDARTVKIFKLASDKIVSSNSYCWITAVPPKISDFFIAQCCACSKISVK